MSIFSKNPNESAYVGGKKHWTDVIKNSGSGELLIWRQPEEDFNTNSTLIVMPGEQALFIKGGVVEQIFDNGTYQLSTQNYPFISRLRNAFSGGISTFSCVVYFFRTAHSMEILWGTDSPIQVRDKLLGIATKLRARGAYKVQIENPALFLEKLVGNNVPYQLQEELSKYFINEFQSKIKSIIARAINETNAEIIGIDARLDEFSDVVKPYMQETVGSYGLRCISFSIAAIDIDDDELRRKYDEIDIDAIAKLRSAQADRGVMDILGENWGRQQAANILGDLANNPGAGGVAAAGAGMGMGLGAAGAFGSMAQQMFSPMNNGYSQQSQQAAPTPPVVSNRFEPKTSEEQASTVPNSDDDPMAVLTKLKKMLDAGLIEQSEYDAKKADILTRM